jgi:hypothetical protein
VTARTYTATALLAVEYVLDEEFLNEVREWYGDHLAEGEEISLHQLDEFCKDRLFDPACRVLGYVSAVETNNPKEGTNG